MAGKNWVWQRLAQGRVVGVIRTDQDPEVVLEAARAVTAGGINCIEVSFNTPQAHRIIEKLVQELPQAVVGAGTVLDAPTSRLAILAGAQYLVCPVLKEEVLNTANRYGVLAIPGIFTPSEALRAWELGALLVKVFPASILGPTFIRSLRVPLPQLEFLPTGGITVDNAPEYIRAGALAVCVGSALFSHQTLQARDYTALERKAREFVQAVQMAKT